MTKLALCSGALLLAAAVTSVADQKTTQAQLLAINERVPAPALELENASRKPLRLSTFRGQTVVINLWATTCGGCIAELPDFVRLSNAYKDKGVTVIGISFDVMYAGLKNASEGWARVKPFVAARGMTYPIVMDNGSAEKALNVTALPATYLVDRRGRIAATYVGVVDAADLEKNIKALLAEGR
jgi:peroxiredoxin